MNSPNQVVVSQVNDVTTVEITTAGPQGIQGEPGETTFTGLTDTPANFVAGKVLKVNSGANAIEYADDINTTNLSYTVSTRVLASDTGTNVTIPLVDTTNAGLLSASDKTKLDGIEDNSKDDQTGAEIKSLYEGESDTNVFSDAEKTKLSGIEASATADQTDEEIQDIVGAMLTGNTESGITVTYQDADGTIDFAVASQTDENFTTADHTKLDGIEASATADQTNAEIKTAYEANSDTNAFTDAEKTKLTGIETSATADQTGAEIKTAYEAESNTNAFTDAEKSKLTAIEASADVTDATNVDAAGAVMNTDASTAAISFVIDEDNMASDSDIKVPTQQSVKAYVLANSSDTTYTAGTGLSLSGTTFNVDQIALTTVQTAANESAQLALTTQEGDIVVRSDQNKSYVRNSGTAGTMADFTELLTPTDQVLSVAGNTGAVTAAQIAAAVEAASDSNTFTDADHTKLNAIESGATADQTATEIKTSYESNSNTNVFTDAEKSKLNTIQTSATADQTAAEIRTLVESASDSNVFTDADHSKLDAIEASATADQTGAEIKSLYEGESDTNAFTDAEKSKLNTIQTSATDDQTASEIKTLLNSDGIVNAQIDASAAIAGTKISPDFTSNLSVSANSAIATISATNASNTSVSTLLYKNRDGNSNLRDIASIEGESTGNGGYGALAFHTAFNNSLVEQMRIGQDGQVDFTGNVDCNAGIDVTGNISVSGTVDGRDVAADGTKLDGIEASATADQTASEIKTLLQSDKLTVNEIANDAVTTDKINLISTSSVPSLEAKGDGSTDGYIQLNCSQNSHGVKLKAPPHSASASYTFTLPNDIQNGKILSTDASGNTSWVDNYTNTSVDTHLNTGTASNNEVLSWNGSDYTWVAQSTGGGGSMNNLVEDTSPQLGGNLDMQSNNITGTGTITANSVANSANGMRKITASTSTPSGGSDGDIWVKYTA